MEPNVIDYLKSVSTLRDEKENGLIKLIEDNEIPVRFHIFPFPYNEASAATSHEGIFINQLKMRYFSHSETPPAWCSNEVHIILHEIGHFLHIKKIGHDNINSAIRNLKDYKGFFNHILEEERFAERFARLAYYKLRGLVDSTNVRLNLDDEYYIQRALHYANYVYNELVKSKLDFFEYTKKSLLL